MKKWQDDVFDGRRIDTSESTGAGTLNLKKIANDIKARNLYALVAQLVEQLICNQ